MDTRTVTTFYDRHPINAWQILTTLERQGKSLAQLTPPDLFPLDQDHYGGLEATDILAAWAGVGPDSHVLDICAGLGGPARYLAWRRRSASSGATPSPCPSAPRASTPA